MSTNTVTLKLTGTSDLSKINNDLKNLGTTSKTAATNLKDATSQLDKTSKTTQTFGQRLKGFGSNFGTLSGSVSTLGGTLVNLNRQYQDLNDTQIRVDRTALKVSKTSEARATAEKKLQDLIAKGVTSGAEYEQAQLDVQQATEAATLAVTMHGEALEDQQRAQEDFWMGLIPTITSAGTTASSVLQTLSGGKGLAGLKSAFTGLTGAGGPIGALTSALSGLGGKGGGLISGLATAIGSFGANAAGSVGGINAMAGATGGLGAAFKTAALSFAPFGLAVAGFVALLKPLQLLVHEFNSLIKGETQDAIQSMIDMVDVFTGEKGNLFTKFLAMMNPASSIAELTGLTDQIKKILEETKQKMIETGKGAATAKTTGLDPFEEGLNQINAVVDQVNVGLGQVNPAIDGTGQGAQAAAQPVAALGTGLGEVAQTAPAAAEAIGNFATITKFGLGEVMGGAAKANDSIIALNNTMQMTNGFTDPYSVSLDAAAFNSNYLGSESYYLQQQLMGVLGAAKQNVDLQKQLSKALNQASASMNKQASAAQKLYRTNLIPTSKTLSGPRNPNFRLRSDYQRAIIGSPQAQQQMLAGNRPKVYSKVKTKKAQHGMHETVNEATWILAGEAGPESVNISPTRGGRRGRGGGGGAGGGGGGPCFNIYIGGKRIMEDIRYSINDNAGVMK